MKGTAENPGAEWPSTDHVRSDLLKGKLCKFAPEDSETRRTIPADWLRDAVVAGKRLNVQNAIVVGVLRLKYATVDQEVSLRQCEFRARLDFSYCVFKRNVILTGTSFHEGLNLDSATFEYDLFANDIKGLGNLETVNLRDARIGGSLFCDESNFDTSFDCQNLKVGNDGFFRGATFNGATDFSDSKFGGALFFGPNSAESRSAAKFNGDTDFDRISVGGNADLEEVTFSDSSTTVRFRNANIAGTVMFSGAVFSGPVSFAHTFSAGQVQFQGSVFKGKATFTGLRVSRSALFRANPVRSLPAPTFEKEATFHDIDIGSSADFEGAMFKCDDDDAEIHFDRARIKGNLRFQGSSFGVKVILPSVQVGGQFLADAGVFRKDFVCSGMKVAGSAFFRQAVFGSEVRFHGTHFCENTFFEGARFDGKASFLRIKIESDATFSLEDGSTVSTAAFGSDADFTDAYIGGNAEFSKVVFAASAVFDSLSVEKSAFFQDTVFSNGADFTGFHTRQDATFDRAQFRNATTSPSQPKNPKPQTSAVTFQGAEILSDANFGDARFEADTSFEDAIIHGGAFFDAATFSRGSKPSFSGTHFKHGAFFRDASFHDVANFRVTRFGLEARFQGTKFHKRAIFDGAIFEGIAEFRSGELRGDAIPAAVFSDVSFEHARFEQDARFDDTLFTKPAGFRETSLKALYLSPDGYTGKRRRMQFKQGIDFRGCQYDRIQVDWKALLLLGEYSQAAPGILKWSGFRDRVAPRQQPYDRQPYIQLEGALRTSGRTEDADHVYLERRRVERHVRWTKGQYGRWATDVLFWLGARYGVRPFRLVVFSILLIATGTWFFSHPGTLSAPRDGQAQPRECENNPSRYRALGESLHEFLPVDIPMGSECVAATRPVVLEVKPFWVVERLLTIVHLHGFAGTVAFSVSPATFASLILRLPGWIFVPLGVASLAGLLRRSSTS